MSEGGGQLRTTSKWKRFPTVRTYEISNPRAGLRIKPSHYDSFATKTTYPPVSIFFCRDRQVEPSTKHKSPKRSVCDSSRKFHTDDVSRLFANTEILVRSWLIF